MIDEIELSALRSDRTTRARIAILLNIDMLLDCAKAEGRDPSFWTFTYATLGTVKEMAADWSTFLRRLRKHEPVAGVRVFELGRRTQRFHVHAIFDRRVPIPVVESCKEGLRLGHSNVKRVADNNLARYLYKEFNKQIGRRDIPGRQWGCFGKLPEQRWVTMSSLDLQLPWQIHRYHAFLTKEVGEPIREVMLRAFKDWLNTLTPGLARLKNGELYITNIMTDSPATMGMRAPLKAYLHRVDHELLECLEDPDLDPDTDSIIIYKHPNPGHEKNKPNTVPL